jgi:pyridinium-3,5-bisthiocarboxylic acid mononucleotide nickel chelatase
VSRKPAEAGKRLGARSEPKASVVRLRPLHFDCFSGASGNMLLGALLELGAPQAGVRAELDKLGIDGLRMRTSKVDRGALTARYVSFSAPERSHVQRHYRAIRNLLRRAPLRAAVRSNALRVFEKLGQAEARIHGVPLDDVHFHEVGNADTLGDVVGVCAAIDLLGVGRITASPIALGHGTVSTEHGILPLPAPASLELLKGVPTYPMDVAWETLTPTGAALLVTLVDEFGPLPAMRPEAQGFGAGNDRPGPVPNVLRAVLGSPAPELARDRVVVLETHLDDMNPEALPFLIERLLEEGALDASLSPLAMKKGRPGQLLRVIARPVDGDRLARQVLLHSTALGVRQSEMPRLLLEREVRPLATSYGRIRVKFARTPDGRISSAPEYEDCAQAARRHGVALREVYRAAERAAEECV